MRLWVQSLASLSGLRIRRCRELWRRSAAVALIQPLAWEFPYAAGAALKSKNKKQKKTCLDTSEFAYEEGLDRQRKQTYSYQRGGWGGVN